MRKHKAANCSIRRRRTKFAKVTSNDTGCNCDNVAWQTSPGRRPRKRLKKRSWPRKRARVREASDYRVSPQRNFNDGTSNRLHYVFYSIVNTSFLKSPGRIADSVAKCLLTLYIQLDGNKIKSQYLDDWEDAGEQTVILKGINHKHLKFLAESIKYSAIDSHRLMKEWGRSEVIICLTVFGRPEDLEDTLEDLTELR